MHLRPWHLNGMMIPKKILCKHRIQPDANLFLQTNLKISYATFESEISLQKAHPTCDTLKNLSQIKV